MKRFKYAWQGFVLSLKDKSMLWHYLSALAITVFAYVTSFSWLEWILVLIAISMVILAEGFNTCIELLSNRITTKEDLQIKNIKDYAAGLVLLASLISAGIGILLLFHHFGG